MDALGLLVRAGLVFGLLGITLYVLRRVDLGRASGRSSAPVQVIATTRVGKGASVAVVRIGGASYALGVTEHAVSLLLPTELPAGAAAVVPDASGPSDPSDVPAPPPSFAAALQAQVQQLVHPRRRDTDPHADPHARTDAGADAALR